MTETPIGKGFDWALSRMREGAHVRRAEWDGGVSRLAYATVGEWVDGSKRILLYSADGSYISWWPHPDDLLAVDWCVA